MRPRIDGVRQSVAYSMCSARYWRAGFSQPSRASGSDFSIYIGIYIYIYIYILGECMALLASGSDPTA